MRKTLTILVLMLGLTGCASIKDKIGLGTDDFKTWLVEKIPEADRILGSTTKDEGTTHTGVEVVQWAKGQDKGYITIEIWDLQPPIDKNKVGPEYYLMVSRGDNIRRGDTMTMAKRGKRNELRHYYTCAEPAYGKKICGSVGSSYPGVYTILEWEWKPGSMDFRVNGQSAKSSPVKDYAGAIKSLWIPGCPNAVRCYPAKWRNLSIQTPDKPKSGAEAYWKALTEDSE